MTLQDLIKKKAEEYRKNEVFDPHEEDYTSYTGSDGYEKGFNDSKVLEFAEWVHRKGLYTREGHGNWSAYDWSSFYNPLKGNGLGEMNSEELYIKFTEENK